jgi:hypothetical protein
LDEIKNNISAELQHYRDILIRLEETEKLRDETEKELEGLRKKLAKMPVLDEKTIFKDWGHYNRKKGSWKANRRRFPISVSEWGGSPVPLWPILERLDEIGKQIAEMLNGVNQIGGQVDTLCSVNWVDSQRLLDKIQEILKEADRPLFTEYVKEKFRLILWNTRDAYSGDCVAGSLRASEVSFHFNRTFFLSAAFFFL